MYVCSINRDTSTVPDMPIYRLINLYVFAGNPEYESTFSLQRLNFSSHSQTNMWIIGLRLQ
jgi:hypothetical protein